MDQNEYVVGWGTLALINAGLAQTKNRSALLWFLVSVVLGPVATLVVMVVPQQPPPKRRPRPQPAPRPDDSDPGQTTPAHGS